MIAKWILATATTPLLLILAPAQQRVPTTIVSANGRFQLFGSQVEYQAINGNDVSAHEVFMIDTQSGRVWRFQPNSEIETSPGKRQFVEEKFVAVGIDQ